MAQVVKPPEIEPLKTACESGKNNSIPKINVNNYVTTKTIAQGFLDIALLTANASQLKSILRVGEDVQPLYVLLVTLISISIFLQVTVGVCFVFIGTLDINNLKSQRTANNLNNLITIKIFLILVLNVFVSVFATEPTKQADNKCECEPGTSVGAENVTH